MAALLLTGHSMAQARGMTSPTGEIVLCTGQGVVTILVDANGQPTGAAHICPECALTFFGDVGQPLVLPEPVLSAGTRVRFTHAGEAAARHILRATARGPPSFL